MTDVTPNADHNDAYWQGYGLNRDPFEGISHDSYYPVAQWEKHLDLMHHLIHYSNVLLSVTACRGCGKSTLLQQFLQQIADDGRQVHSVQGQSQITPEMLVTVLADAFNLSTDVSSNTLQTLERQVEEIQLLNEPCLLVFEDAEQLSDTCLTVLLELIQLQSESQMRLHMVLVGDVSLQSRLESVAELNDLHDTVYHIVIEPLTQQQVQQYLEQRFRAAGLVDRLPLQENQLNRIWHMSQGIPGRINEACVQVLMHRSNGMALEKPSSPLPNNASKSSIKQLWRKQRVTIIIGVLLLGLLLVVAVITHLRQQTKPQVVKSSIPHLESSQQASKALHHVIDKVKQKPNSKKSKKVKVQAKLMKLPSVLQISKVSHLQVALRPAVLSAKSVALPLGSDHDTLQAGKKINKTTASEIKEASKSKVTGSKPKLPSKAKPKVKVKTKVKAKAKTKKRKKGKNAAQHYSEDEQFLLRQKPNAYTLQLMASVDKSKLLKEGKVVLNKPEYPAYLFRYGPNWYVLTFGVYETIAKARIAEKTLPKSLRQVIKPWPRSLKLIQDEIKKPR